MKNSWLPDLPDGENEYATVRLSRIELTDFKSVENGVITFSLQQGRASICGIYGQNGSGKTAIIQAIAILKCAMAGMKIPRPYAECIAAGKESANLSFEFDFSYPDGRLVRVGYEFDLKKARCSDRKNRVSDGTGHVEYFIVSTEDNADEQSQKEVVFAPDCYKVVIENEVIRIGGEIDGVKRRFKDVLSTVEHDIVPFGPKAKHGEFIRNKDDISKLIAVKELTKRNSQSFFFADECLEIFSDNRENQSPWFRVVAELHHFAMFYLHVVDSRSYGLISSDQMIVFFTRYGGASLKLFEPSRIPDGLYESITRELNDVNCVLAQFIPGLEVGIKKLGESLADDGSIQPMVEPVAMRDGKELPLRCESDGVKKIISILNLVITVYNSKSTTIAIDEFDAGIFEYLLGEILQIFEESGKGQLIFTSHNLRPLEVISKESIVFTTTNPSNRYTRMKGVGHTNNLRDMYFREILINEQDEELYSSAKRHKIISALRKVGRTHAV